MIKERLLFVAAAMTLVACSELTPSSEAPLPITFTSSIDDFVGGTGAQGTFRSGENINLLFTETGKRDWQLYYFTSGEDGAMNPVYTPFYPADPATIDIVAIYPTTAGGGSLFIDSQQMYEDSYKRNDLMIATVTNQARQESPVKLTFTHKLAKVIVNVTQGEGISDIIFVNLLNILSIVNFDVLTGKLDSASGPAIPITLINNSNNGAAFIPPQTLDGEFLSIETDEGTAVYSIKNKVLESGHQYTFDVTVKHEDLGKTTAL